MSKKFKAVSRWVLGLGIMTFIILQLSPEVLVKHIHTLNVGALMLSLAAKFSLRLLTAYKWYILLIVHQSSLSFKNLLRIHLAGSAIGSFLPVVGPDLTMGYSYYRYSGSASQTISSLLMDRLIAGYITILTGLLGILWGWSHFNEINSVLFVVGGVFLGAAIPSCGIVFFLCRPMAINILPIPQRWKVLLLEIAETSREYFTKRPELLFFNVVLSLITQGMRILAIYSLAPGIGIQASIVDFIAVVPVIFLIVMIPIYGGGLGVQEGAFFLILGMIGISAESAFTMSVISRGLTWITLLPGTILFMVNGLVAKAPIVQSSRVLEK